MLADGKTVALVTPDARVTWLCHPRPDSAPLFAELVGGRAGGSLAVRPAHDGAPTAQRYLDGTLTLETRWAGLIVRDYLDRGEPYGRVRLVRVLEGTAEAIVEFTPRPDFGRTPIAPARRARRRRRARRGRPGRALRTRARLGDRGRRRAAHGARAASTAAGRT